MPFDPAKHFGFEDDPRKVGLLFDTTVTEPKPTTIAVLLELEDETIIVGTHFPDDIFRTEFDRFTGLALDGGRLKQSSIPPSELARIEKFAATGVYKTRPPEWGPAPGAPAEPVPAPAPAAAPEFDVDAML